MVRACRDMERLLHGKRDAASGVDSDLYVTAKMQNISQFKITYRNSKSSQLYEMLRKENQLVSTDKTDGKYCTI